MGRDRQRLERLERLLPDPFGKADGLVPTTDGGRYLLQPGSGGGGVASVTGDGSTVTIDNSDPSNPVVSAQLALDSSEAYTNSAISAIPKRLTFIFDGGGEPVVSGMQYEIPAVRRGGTISRWRILAPAGEVGSCIIDIFRGISPHPSGSITASDPPEVINLNTSTGTSLTGWSKQIQAGDYIAAKIISTLNFTSITLTIDY